MKNSARDQSIGAQMAIALQLMKKQNHQVIADVGYKITMEQLVVLEVLHTNGAMNMTELSKTTWKQNANITRIVDKLEKQKLVARNAVEGDRRANLLSITTKGEQLFKDVIPSVVEVYKDAISTITKEEEEITLDVLQKIISHLA